jgi:hypothetical protein
MYCIFKEEDDDEMDKVDSNGMSRSRFGFFLRRREGRSDWRVEGGGLSEEEEEEEKEEEEEEEGAV